MDVVTAAGGLAAAAAEAGGGWGAGLGGAEEAEAGAGVGGVTTTDRRMRSLVRGGYRCRPCKSGSRFEEWYSYGTVGCRSKFLFPAGVFFCFGHEAMSFHFYFFSRSPPVLR